MKTFLFWFGAMFIFCSITFAETLTKTQYFMEYTKPSIIKKSYDKVVIKYENKEGIASLKSLYFADMSDDLKTYLNIDKKTYNKYVDQKTNRKNGLSTTSNYQSFTTKINNDNVKKEILSSQPTPIDIIVIIILIVIVYYIYSSFKKKRDSQIVSLRGTGTYSFNIVGESHYQTALKKICGGYSDESQKKIVTATLIHENNNPYDNEAIRVDVGGRTVGYLSREDAREYRKKIKRVGYAGMSARCSAMIVEGWNRGGGDWGYFGVKLDLPTKN